MADVMTVEGVVVLCRWCGNSAFCTTYGDWVCLGCKYEIAVCRCSRANQPMAPEATAIIPLQPWG